MSRKSRFSTAVTCLNSPQGMSEHTTDAADRCSNIILHSIVSPFMSCPLLLQLVLPSSERTYSQRTVVCVAASVTSIILRSKPSTALRRM
jgi:hypothetical protein